MTIESGPVTRCAIPLSTRALLHVWFQYAPDLLIVSAAHSNRWGGGRERKKRSGYEVMFVAISEQYEVVFDGSAGRRILILFAFHVVAGCERPQPSQRQAWCARQRGDNGENRM